MREGPDIAHIASLVGDPARANMLTALVGGTALTASELALEAGVIAADGELASGQADGRRPAEAHRRKAGIAITRWPGRRSRRCSRSIMGVAAVVGPQRVRPGPRDKPMREARVCYDHLRRRHRRRDARRIAGAMACSRGRTMRSLPVARPTRISRRAASTCGRCPASGGRSAAPASTGACGARIWRARWAPPSSTRRSPRNGRGARATGARWCSRRRAGRRSSTAFLG